MPSDPFESDDHEYLVVVNDLGQHSLWPRFLAVPQGWDRALGPTARSACLDYIEKNWPEIQPARPA
jgi:MbtH protein